VESAVTEGPDEPGEPAAPVDVAGAGAAPPSFREDVSQGAPVEIHPPHAAAHSIKDFLLQLVTITAGVLIALSIEGLLEWNHHRLLVREAKETIAREIVDNKNALARHFKDWDRSSDGIEKSLTLANDLLATKKSDINEFELQFHMSSLSDAGWRTAERTGALTYMDYADVQAYARLYGYQDLYVSQQRRVMERTVSALSQVAGSADPHTAPPGDLERFRLELLALRGEMLADKQLGESLLKAYDEALAHNNTAK
jgi:hypothetical protein